MAKGPKRADPITLHELEGQRYVLEHPDERFLELEGESDAFVWARLDGETPLDELAAAHLEAFDTVHPDLPGLIARLEAGGYLAQSAPPPPAVDSGSRLWTWAVSLARVRLPAPRLRPFWLAVGRATAPLFATPVGLIAIAVAAAGLVVALNGLAPAPTLPLLEAPGGYLARGILLLLLLNLAVDLLEAIAQVGVLARSKRPPGRIGLSFDLGIPGIYIDTPDAILLPRARRVRLLLAPLVVAAVVGGAAALLRWQLVGASAVTLALLHKLTWVAWLRAVVHLNPLGPGPLYDALRLGADVPGLRKLARRFLRLGPWTDGEEGYSPRELFLLGYCCGVVAYAVLGARVGVALLTDHLLPVWQAAQGAGHTTRLAALLILGVLLGIPTLLALAAGVLLLLQAGLQALARTEWFSDTRSLAGVLAGAILLASGAPWALQLAGVVGLEVVLLDLGWGLTGLLAVAGVGLGWGLTRRSGAGWGGLDGLAIGCTSGALGLAWVGTALGLGSVLGGALVGGLILLAAGFAYAWAVLEVLRLLPERTPEAALPPGPRDLLDPRVFLAGLGPLVALSLLALELFAFSPTRLAPFPALLFPALGVSTLAAILLGVACWRGRSGARAPGLLLGLTALAALLVGLRSWWNLGGPSAIPGPLTARGLHLPLLSVALLTAAALLLRQAFDAVLGPARRLPPLHDALQGSDEARREVSAAAWFLDALAFGVIDLYGDGLNRAVAGPLEDEGLCLKGDAPGDRTHRHREAIVRYAHGVGRRMGDRVLEELLEGVLARLPAVAHERLEAHARGLLPGLGAIAEAPRERRRALLRQVVQLTDFDDAALDRLADWVGVQVVEPGRVVIRQGDRGERFFLVARGRLEVWVEDAGGEDRRVATLTGGDAFGEAALLTHAVRSATVIAAEPSLLLTLDRPVFAELLRARTDLLERVFARQEDLELVREVPLFADMAGAQVTALCRRFGLDRAGAGDTIIAQGDTAERFYLIREGEVEVRRADDDAVSTLATLGRGEYFGEIALLHDRPRTASVVALAETQLLTLDREAFQTLLSGQRDALHRTTSERLSAQGEDV